ncbi:anther-specific protein SF18-like [Gallus gallus]|uniref:anther-specific protein SF18-like n=1 Tax=Gallus gallus TaxID=9031 RepID=UPI001AE728F9|nr:anther-specific protein SF18-like [Gallus gallus]XP_046782596.1 anther-specific protein SF18-like [Gallus gallus]
MAASRSNASQRRGPPRAPLRPPSPISIGRGGRGAGRTGGRARPLGGRGDGPCLFCWLRGGARPPIGRSGKGGSGRGAPPRGTGGSGPPRPAGSISCRAPVVLRNHSTNKIRKSPAISSQTRCSGAKMQNS